LRLPCHFRKRINQETINNINKTIVENEVKKKLEAEELSEKKNRGKLLADATCTPADIKYPTDINLLNSARKQTEKVIDILHKNRQNLLDKKPGTYRNLARKDYLTLAKKRMRDF
jgi:hypothetical protein